MYDHLSDQELIEAAKATRALGITILAEALDHACALRCLSPRGRLSKEDHIIWEDREPSKK